jgi:hypothetical protein
MRRRKEDVAWYTFGMALTCGAMVGLMALCLLLTPALWSPRLPMILPVGFYLLSGMNFGLLVLLLRSLNRERRESF